MKTNHIRVASVLALAILIPACGSKHGGGGGGGVVVPPSNTPAYILSGGSVNTVVTKGGTGATLGGGGGGYIALHNWSVSNAFIRTTGAVDTTFAIPTPTNMTLGTNVKTISADTVMGVGTGLTNSVQSIVGDDGVNNATGLHILPGVKLTLNPNYDNNGSAGTLEQVNLAFGDGILIEGTLKTGLREGTVADAAELVLTAANVVCRPGSTVDVSGSNNPGGVGGTAGPLNFYCYGSSVTQGAILATGGNGNTGGASFGVGLLSYYWGVYNTGDITTSGGTGANGVGGDAGVILLKNSAVAGSFTGGGAFNSGDLTAVGGSGTTGGGIGGYMNLGFNYQPDGPLVISGVLNSTGGSCTGASGAGGLGGSMDLNSVGGHLRFSGTCITRGGTGTGAGAGGAGGHVALSANNGGLPGIDQLNFDGCYIGGSIDTSGGPGATGGLGGFVEFWDNAGYQAPDGIPFHSPMYLVGYSLFDTTGGQGATSGGNGGYITFENVAVGINGNNNTLFQGSITNSVPLQSRGGQGFGTTGGAGGGVFIGDNESTEPSAAPDTSRTTTNSAAINATGGQGATSGGLGGNIYLYGRFNVSNSGALTTSGGVGGTGNGGNANQIRIRSDGPTLNQAVLTSNGGDSTSGQGGGGNTIFVDGYTATTVGTLNNRGGNSVSNFGGNGGGIEIGSWNGITLSSITGTLNVQGGTGATDGFAGIVTVDGIRQTLVAGSKTY